MAKVQKVSTKKFKEEAVRLAQTSGKPITQVARELGISDPSIHQWRKELAAHGPEALPGSGHQTKLEEENRRLKREWERVQQERDILKSSEHLFAGIQMRISVYRTTEARISRCGHVPGPWSRGLLQSPQAPFLVRVCQSGDLRAERS